MPSSFGVNIPNGDQAKANHDVLSNRTSNGGGRRDLHYRQSRGANPGILDDSRSALFTRNHVSQLLVYHRVQMDVPAKTQKTL